MVHEARYLSVMLRTTADTNVLARVACRRRRLARPVWDQTSLGTSPAIYMQLEAVAAGARCTGATHPRCCQFKGVRAYQNWELPPLLTRHIVSVIVRGWACACLRWRRQCSRHEQRDQRPKKRGGKEALSVGASIPAGWTVQFGPWQSAAPGRGSAPPSARSQQTSWPAPPPAGQALPGRTPLSPPPGPLARQ